MLFDRLRVAGLSSLLLLISSSVALPLVADDCSGVAAYASGSVYTGGQQVVYNSQLWKARWWTQNETPSSAGTGVWQFVADCGGDGGTAPAGYTWCANENDSYTFGQAMDVAYGANGAYVYKTGVSGTIAFNNATFGDPIPGVVKAGYYKNATSAGPAGYTWCADENGTFSLSGTCDIAFGANGTYSYLYGRTGTITFNPATFGDPLPGIVKSGYYKSRPAGPAWYTWIANENDTVALTGTCDVAYGANGNYNYLSGKTGSITFNNATFGDPIFGTVKYGFSKSTTPPEPPKPPILTDVKLVSWINNHVKYNGGSAMGYKSDLQSFCTLSGGDVFLDNLLKNWPNTMLDITSAYSGAAASYGGSTSYCLSFWDSYPERRVPTLIHEFVHHMNNGVGAQNYWNAAVADASKQWDSYAMNSPAEYIACGFEWVVETNQSTTSESGRQRIYRMDPGYYLYLVNTFIPWMYKSH